MAYLRQLRPYFARETRGLAIGSVAGLVSNLAIVLPAIAIGRAIDATLAIGRGTGSRSGVATAALVVVGATAAHEVPKMAKRWWLNVAWAAMRASIRADAYRGAITAGAPPGDSVSRIVNDAELVAGGFGEVVFETWDTVVLTATLVVAMVVLDPGLAAWALTPVPFAVAVSALAGRFVATRTASARRVAGAVSTAMAEQLRGLRLLRACGAVTTAVARVERASADLTGRQLAVARIEEAAAPLAGGLLGAGIALVLWRGGISVVEGSITVGGLVAFLQLYVRFAGRGARVVRMVTTLRIGGAAFERVRPLLTRPFPAQPDGTAPTCCALDGVSLDVPAGGLVAITGPVGSGKSTLCRALVSRAEGPVGYVPQEPPLFSGTVLENVLLGCSPEDPERVAQRALDIAGLGTELTLGTAVGERGVRVSGGQRQRIALARAVAAAGDSLLILDDPFSAIDVETEARVVAALRALPATKILCSSRLNAFPEADLVAVLDDGRLAEIGTHAQLVAAGGTYARIVAAQRRLTQVAGDGG